MLQQAKPAQQSSQSATPPPPPPPPPKQSGGGGFKFFALALTGFTVGIGYVALNPDSRRQIESYVPQSQYLFDYIDGLLNTNKKSEQPAPPAASIKPPQPIFKPYKHFFLAKTWFRDILFTYQMYLSNRNEAPAAPKTSEKKPPAPVSKPSTTSTAPPAPAAAQQAVAATQTQSSSKTESKSSEKQPEKELDWKKHVKEFDLQEEATVNGIILLFIFVFIFL